MAFWKMQDQREKSDQWLPWAVMRGVDLLRQGVGTAELFWSDKNVLYPDCGGGYKAVHLRQNSESYT